MNTPTPASERSPVLRRALVSAGAAATLLATGLAVPSAAHAQSSDQSRCYRHGTHAYRGYRVPNRLLGYGSSGDCVVYLQDFLMTKYHIATDGHFGSRTLSAVKSFQRREHLTPDGVVGNKTWYKLYTDPPF